MVYGRYNELVNGLYKPTNITGGHHPVRCCFDRKVSSYQHSGPTKSRLLESTYSGQNPANFMYIIITNLRV